MPIAVVANYNNLGSLKQHTFIISQYWKPEVQNESLEKNNLWTGVHHFLKTVGDNCFFAFSSF